MIVKAQVLVKQSREALWSVLTNIADAATFMSGIERIEILEKPTNGLVGLKWKETRIYFGKPESVEKEITDAKEYESFKSHSQIDGFVFLTTTLITGKEGNLLLMGIHETKPQGIIARLKSLPMFLVKGVIQKAILQDLNDIKNKVEHTS